MSRFFTQDPFANSSTKERNFVYRYTWDPDTKTFTGKYLPPINEYEEYGYLATWFPNIFKTYRYGIDMKAGRIDKSLFYTRTPDVKLKYTPPVPSFSSLSPQTVTEFDTRRKCEKCQEPATKRCTTKNKYGSYISYDSCEKHVRDLALARYY